MSTYSETHQTVVLALRELAHRHCTTADIATALKLSPTAASHTLRWLYFRKLVRVCAWRRFHGNPARVYCIADGNDDAPRLRPLTGSQKGKRYRKNIRNRNEGHAHARA